MDALLTDLRHARRALTRRPAFALLVVLTLAVGMSVNAVAFTVVNGFLFKRPAFPDLDRLGWIFSARPGNPYGESTLVELEAFRRDSRTLDAVIAEGRMPLGWRDQGRAATIWSLVVSADYFTVLGARAEAGRVFTEADRSEPVAVVSHRFWSEHLHGAPVGTIRDIVLNDQAFAVIGVLADDFRSPGGLYAPDVWVPLDSRIALGLPAELEDATRPWLILVGRLRPGTAPAAAEAELRAIGARLGAEHPAAFDQLTPRVAEMKRGHPEAQAMRGLAAIGMGAVGLVLLIACFNVAGLLLARAREREREVGIRAALGASAGRLTRQLVTEALLLAALAGLLALALSAASPRLLAAFSLPAPVPQRLNLALDARAVVFTFLMVALAGVLPVLVPARHARRVNLALALTGAGAGTGGPRGTRARRVFQVVQIAGATLFLALAVLFISSFRKAATADLGFESRHVAVVTLDPGAHGVDVARTERVVSALVERVRGLPGVRRAAASRGIPYTVGAMLATRLSPDGRDCRTADCPPVGLFVIGPHYLETMGIALVRGRHLVAADAGPGGRILISQSLADRHWPGRDPIGEWVRLGEEGEPAEIAGIVRDVKARGFGASPAPSVYRPIRPDDYGHMLVVVARTEGSPGGILEAVRREAAAIDPAFPLRSVQTMEEHLALPLWAPRVAAWFVGVCGAVALVLGAVGLFGVVSFAVAQRRREFGVRMAIGASPGAVLRLVVAEGLLLTAVGALVGLAGGVAAGRAVQAALVGVSASSPLPYLAAAAVQAAVALAACAHPAWRASRVDPLAVIRSE